MSTLYFTADASTVALSGEQSPLTTNWTWPGSGANGYAQSGLQMVVTQPAAAAAVSGLSVAVTTQQTCLCQTWVSAPLDAQTINAGTWTLVVNGRQSNANANFWISGVNPTTAFAYGYVFSSGSAAMLFSGKVSGYLEAGGPNLESGTLAGDAQTTKSGDVIVVEFLWASGVHANATARNLAIEFGSGGIGYLLAPQTLTFAGAQAFFQHSGPLRIGPRFRGH